jgi:hypothetical protein
LEGRKWTGAQGGAAGPPLEHEAVYKVRLSLRVTEHCALDVAACGLLNVNPRFRGTSRLHPYGRRTGKTRNQHESMMIRNVG